MSNLHYEKQVRSTSSKIARVFVAFFLCACVGSTPGAALAATGSITIQQQANNNAVYDIYRLFLADISEDDVATHIEWSEENRATVEEFLKKEAAVTGATTSYADWLEARGRNKEELFENAQIAAEYISEMILASEEAYSSNPPTKESGTFAENLGQHIALNGTKADQPTATSGHPYTGPEGYYLAVSSPSSIDSGEAGSAPLWIPLGGSINEIQAKEIAPSFEFEIKDDHNGAKWGKAADSHHGQDLQFHITSTVPGNIGAFDSYRDRYLIDFPAGIDPANNDASSVRVSLDGMPIEENVNIIYDGDRLEIEIANLETYISKRRNADAQQESLQVKEGEIEISFAAHANSEAKKGQAGNTVAATRTYTADPVSLAERSTISKTTQIYLYGASVIKLDKSTGEPLEHAKYSIQASNGTATNKNGLPLAQAPAVNSDAASAGKYIQEDGSLGDAPFEFESDAQGCLNIPTLDEGTYIIHETSAPPTYELQDTDCVLAINSQLDENDGALSSLSAKLSGGEAAADGETCTQILGVDKASGIISIQAVDDKMLELAGTGLMGNGLFYILAGILAGAATIALVATNYRPGNRR